MYCRRLRSISRDGFTKSLEAIERYSFQLSIAWYVDLLEIRQIAQKPVRSANCNEKRARCRYT